MGERMRLRLAPEPTSADDAARALARWLLPFLRDELARDRRDDELVDVVATIPAPKRTVMLACRSGAITGAHKVGRRWLATRAAVDAWIRDRGPRAVKGAAGDALNGLRERIARGAR